MMFIRMIGNIDNERSLWTIELFGEILSPATVVMIAQHRLVASESLVSDVTPSFCEKFLILELLRIE